MVVCHISVWELAILNKSQGLKDILDTCIIQFTSLNGNYILKGYITLKYKFMTKTAYKSIKTHEL